MKRIALLVALALSLSASTIVFAEDTNTVTSESVKKTLENAREATKTKLEAIREEQKQRAEILREEQKQQVETLMEANKKELEALKEERKIEFKKIKEEQKTEQRKKIEERLVQKIENTIKRLNQNVENLEKIASRLDARVVVLKKDGKDTVAVETALASARDHIKMAKDGIAKLPALRTDGAQAEKLSEGFEGLKLALKEIEIHLKNAKLALSSAIGAAKGLGPVATPASSTATTTTATSTATTTTP